MSNQARRVLITGGASGIGAATVARFRADGARVAALDLDPDSLERISVDVRVAADVSVEEEILSGVDEAVGGLGGLDVLVTCAGVACRGSVADTELEDWEHVFGVNVRGIFLSAKAALPHLRAAGGGAIVNVASQHGLVAQPNVAAYCASKGAVIQLTRAMAVDHSVEGIRVNAVCPGPTATPMLAAYFADSADPEAERERAIAATLHGRLVEPEEVADAIAYLASPESASTIGAALVVDGGYIVR